MFIWSSTSFGSCASLSSLRWFVVNCLRVQKGSTLTSFRRPTHRCPLAPTGVASNGYDPGCRGQPVDPMVLQGVLCDRENDRKDDKLVTLPHFSRERFRPGLRFVQFRSRKPRSFIRKTFTGRQLKKVTREPVGVREFLPLLHDLRRKTTTAYASVETSLAPRKGCTKRSSTLTVQGGGRPPRQRTDTGRP